MKIDFHTHIMPDELAKRALDSILKGNPTYRAECEGDTKSTLKALKDGGADSAVVLNIANNPQKQHKVNDFAASLQKEHSNLYCFGSVYPGSENELDEMKRCIDMGLYGLKLHPGYQDFYIDDENVFNFYENAEKLGILLAFHVGYDPICTNSSCSSPLRLAKVAKMFSNLKIIAAHMGGFKDEESAKHLIGIENVYLDTSLASCFLSKSCMKDMIQKHGTDKILFGSDSPWGSTKKESDFIESLELSSHDLELIFRKNAQKLLLKE